MDFFEKRSGLFVLGIIAGIGAMILAILGNPKNMAFCIACFIRDIAGSMKFHQAGVVQYFRPEIVGIVLGAFVISIVKNEFRATSGSSTLIRFMLGAIMMVCALVFLGCPLRMVLRMASGEISSYFGLIGFSAGVFTGSMFLKKGFSLGRAYPTKKENGYVLPVILIILFLGSIFFKELFAFSEKGPGSMHAPLIISLIVGIVFGIIAQQSRMCFAGSIRDVILLKDFGLLSSIGGIFVVMLIYNIFTGNFKIVPFSAIAHAQNLWNILSMYAVGFCAVLLGGCPLRQIVMASTGSSDSAVTVIGMFVGAAFAHNFSLAAGAAKVASEGKEAVLGGPISNGKFAVIASIIVLFIVAFYGIKKDKKSK